MAFSSSLPAVVEGGIAYHVSTAIPSANDALDFAYSRQPSRPERFAYSDVEWRAIINDIDSRIQNRYFLLNRPILEKWVWAKTLTTNPVAIEIMSELRSMLVEEFNQIRNKYLHHIPDVVPAEDNLANAVNIILGKRRYPG
jgi:hypothetical protein